MKLAWLALALAVSYSAGAAAYPVLRLRRRSRIAAMLMLAVFILPSPFLVPRRFPVLRLLASIQVVMLLIKLYDLHRSATAGCRPRLRDFLAYLPNPLLLVLRQADAEPRPPAGKDAVRFLVAGLISLGGIALVVLVFRIPWRQFPFLVEHCVKVLAAFAAILSLAAAASAGFRLAGLPAHEAMHHPFLARTPADFWRRYNRPVNRFLREYVFRPLGGPRHPVRATFTAFAISGLIHEYVFDMISLRTAGYQLAFFLIQGVSVAATARIKPRGFNVIPWIAATLAFNLLTGMLFFACMNRIGPFYVRR